MQLKLPQIMLAGAIPVVFAVVAGTAFFAPDNMAFEGPEERCHQQGGEWLHKSAVPTCIQEDGTWLVYSQKRAAFVTPKELALEETAVEPIVPELFTPPDKRPPSAVCPPDPAEYVAETTYTGSIAEVDFSTNQQATRYRTAIRRDVERGVNFAGDAIFAYWGCGEGCQGGAVVRAADGAILSYGLRAQEFVFSTESSLLVLNPAADGTSQTGEYYAVENNTLVRLCQ